MATSKKMPAGPDAQAQMTNFVQTFARPQAAAPARPVAEASAEPEEVAEAYQPETDEAATSPSTSGKKKALAPPDENASWADSYLQPVRTRKTKAIYVDEDTHATLALLTQEAGVGLADLLINIVNQHFEAFRPEIRDFLSERERLKKKKFRF